MNAKDFLKDIGEIDEGVLHTPDNGDYIESWQVEEWLNKFRDIELKNFARKFNIDRRELNESNGWKINTHNRRTLYLSKFQCFSAK